MTSKAARRGRKRKAAPVNLHGEPAQASNRYPSGKAKPEDARATALQARCRVDGIAPTKEALRDAESPLRGCSVGKRILTEAERHHPDLWNAVKHARQTQERFDRAIGAPRATPRWQAFWPRLAQWRPTRHRQPSIFARQRNA